MKVQDNNKFKKSIFMSRLEKSKFENFELGNIKFRTCKTQGYWNLNLSE